MSNPEQFPQTPQQELITGVPDFIKDTQETPQEHPVYEMAPDPTQVSEQIQQDPDWGYTIDAKRLWGEKYGNRHMIGRDSRIEGGVYAGTYGGEAIVVDSKKYPEEIEELFSSVLERARDKAGNVRRDQVLGAVFSAVSDRMKYSQTGVDKIKSDIARQQGLSEFRDGTKVTLNEFIKDGVGVCRHQALAAGLMLEKMKDAGYIRGQISVDRSQRWSPKGEREGHAWVRYTSHSGDVMIIDVAQNYFGLLEDSTERNGWNYMRPGEQQRLAAANVSKVVLPEVTDYSDGLSDRRISREELRQILDNLPSEQ